MTSPDAIERYHDITASRGDLSAFVCMCRHFLPWLFAAVTAAGGGQPNPGAQQLRWFSKTSGLVRKSRRFVCSPCHGSDHQGPCPRYYRADGACAPGRSRGARLDYPRLRVEHFSGAALTEGVEAHRQERVEL